jgi:hypothetical protein
MVIMGLVAASVAAALAVAFVGLAYKRGWTWTGIPSDAGDGTELRPARPSKTVLDWLQLFIVPMVIALAAFGLSAAQSSRQRAVDRRNAAREDKRTADAEREQTLQSYLRETGADDKDPVRPLNGRTRGPSSLVNGLWTTMSGAADARASRAVAASS